MQPYYETDGITIYHGDCRDVLEDLPPVSVDLLLTDPPYGMNFESGHNPVKANVKSDGVRQGMRVVRNALFAGGHLLKPSAHAYVFCHWESFPDFYDTVSAYLRVTNSLVWWKDRGGMGDCEADYARDYELILFAGAGERRALSGRRDGAVLTGHPPPSSKARLHPTEKPVSLLSYLIRKSCPVGGLVLDPFMGSGSALEAAKREGRRAVGIELDERYCEAAARRLSQRTLVLGT